MSCSPILPPGVLFSLPYVMLSENKTLVVNGRFLSLHLVL